ncbi:MAG: efflux RND transporter periplasmic adaptor subunit [Alphaproteobacteria bacterium]|nr:efflux RND transporter periplasmic adaptor subunit [Alphaproteobacteria bacterium]
MRIRSGTGVLFVLGLGFLSACDSEPVAKKENVRPVRAMQITDASAYHQRRFPGKAKAHKEVNLAFRVSGPLVARPVNVGTAVKAGTVVARIDPRDYEVRLRIVQGQLASTRSKLRFAESEYKRAIRIQKEDPGAISGSLIDRRRDSRDALRADLRAAKASVDSTKDDLRYTYLKAPFDGTIVATYVENFENVRAKQAVVRLLDKSQIEMVIDIPENLISNLNNVENVRAKFDAFPDRWIPAKIFEVGREASQTTRTFPVTLLMNQPAGITILPGMAGEATADPKRKSGVSKIVVEIPESSVISDKKSGDSYVWVIDRNTETVARRKITMGRLSNRGIQVTKGLNVGEWVATAGASYLRDGQKVKVLEIASDVGQQVKMPRGKVISAGEATITGEGGRR